MQIEDNFNAPGNFEIVMEEDKVFWLMCSFCKKKTRMHDDNNEVHFMNDHQHDLSDLQEWSNKNDM